MTIKLPRPRELGSYTFSKWVPISIILGAAVILFTFRLESEGLWLDELTSIQDASLPPLEAYKENQLRPLYYFLLMGWLHFGSSDAWLRLLSVIFAMISVFLIYQLGRRLAGETEGLIAAGLLSISPVFINHAQEIRMYVLSLCLGLAGTLFLSKALLTPQDKSLNQANLAGWSIFRLLAIYTVPLNVTLLLPDALLIVMRFRKERAALLSFAKWFLVLIVLWSPSILSVIKESSPTSTYAAHHAGAQPPGLARLIRPLKFLTVWPFRVQESALVALFYKVFTLLVGSLVGAAIIRKHKTGKLLWVFAWFSLPVIPIVVFSYLSVPIWATRYLLFVSPYLFILLAAGFTRLWKQWRFAAVGMGVAYAIAAGGGLMHYYTTQDRPDYKFNIATLEQYEKPGDAIVWTYHYLKPLNHYYSGETDVHWRTFREIASGNMDPQSWVDSFPSGYERLWLVIGRPPEQVGTELENAISSRYTIETTFDYEQNSQVILLIPRSEITAIENTP